MPNWNKEYLDTLKERFNESTADLNARLSSVVEGRVAPAIDDINIGSARLLRGAVLFFDIRSFSKRVNNSSPEVMKSALLMLDCVIPLVMNIVYDFDGYVEKNTGDGIMAIIGAEKTDAEAANLAIDVAITIFYCLENIINPFLQSQNIEPIDARIGIDLDNMLIARIGTPRGSAKHYRNFLTVVSPAANVACHIQEKAGTNEIWVGDSIKRHAFTYRQTNFINVTPIDWDWTYTSDMSVYSVWKYHAKRGEPANRDSVLRIIRNIK